MIRKPIKDDILKISEILTQWTDKEEVDKYLERIKNEIDGVIEFNTRFWVYDEEGVVVGVAGLSDPLPKVIALSKGKKPVELKILYIDNTYRGKGIGKKLMVYLEKLSKDEHSVEMIIRSAKRYKDTAYGFYQKLGYKILGYVDDEMAVFGKLL